MPSRLNRAAVPAFIFITFVMASGCATWDPGKDPEVDKKVMGAAAHEKHLQALLPKTPPPPVETAEDRLWKPPVAERPWKMIVIHHAGFEGGDATSIDKLHKAKGWEGLGYHFVIGNGSMTPDGLIEVGWRWTQQREGAHCRIDPRDDNRTNETGIGICLVGNFELAGHHPSKAQMESLEKLVTWLQARYQVPLDDIKRHQEIKATDCPGRNFPWASFKADLARAAVSAAPTIAAVADSGPLYRLEIK
jgi:hypothetical protein